MIKKIGIVSDHRGVDLKEKIKKYLLNKNYQVEDYGTNSYESVDYPKYALLLGENLKEQKVDLGIAICGTGIGMSIALNKVKKVMCAKIDNINDAYYAKNHNNVNALAISANNSFYKTKKMLNTYLNANVSDDKKHQNRVNMIKKYEEKQ